MFSLPVFGAHIFAPCWNRYVTYAREEEAVRCIQAVHNYVLEGKTLRACFGTTKYCHAWLRNMTCSNPDCLYLHDIGSQEDSFSKDEIISAYTRSRVRQIASNNSQQHSGTILPPPADDFSNSITASSRYHIRSASNSISSQAKGSPPDSNAGKPIVLPAGASWCDACCAACSQVPHAKQKVEMIGNFCLPPVLTESTDHPSAWNDEVATTCKVPENQTLTTNKSPLLLMESTKQAYDETSIYANGDNTKAINSTIYKGFDRQFGSCELLKEKSTSAVNNKDGSLLPSDNKVHRVSDTVDHLSSSIYRNHSHNNGNCSSSMSWNTFVQDKQTPRVGRKMDRYSETAVFPLGRVNDIASYNKYATVEIKRESSIISDILSLDVDPWDDSSATSNSFARLLGETEKQESSFKLLSSWRSNSSNQSRFSFARQESQGSVVQPTRGEAYARMFCSSHDSFEHGLQNGTMFNTFETPNTVINSNPVVSFDKAAGSLKAKISAPPGFSTPSRVPPSDFSSRDRFYQTHEAVFSENHLLSSAVENHYQAQISGNRSDIEFIDPAILAVGKERMSLGINNSGLGLKSTFPAQISASDSDPRIHLLRLQSLSSYHNLDIPESAGDRFLQLGDTYITSRLSAENHRGLSPIAQISFQQLRNKQFFNKQRDGSIDLRTGSDMGLREALRNERFGLTNGYSSNEERKFLFPNGDLYNREFRM
ncbi:hypothetical protein BHE74_00035095 [Ensete ventricosum]|nr:hypothetical protein BHE74_00035095 [Ensete ventricosum]